MNKVIISGKIIDIYDMSNAVVLAKIHDIDNDNIFYAYWENNRFTNIEDKFLKHRVTIQGTLEYIKVLLEDNVNTRRLLAVFVEYLEFYEVD